MSAKEPSAQDLIERLEAFMVRCEKMLDESIEPDLTGMDEQVEELQGTIHELRFEELQNLQPVLQSLMDKLQQLEDKLRHQRDKVKNSLQGINQKKQAHSAYTRAQGVPETPVANDDKDSD